MQLLACGDDQELVRTGFRMILEAEPKMRVLADAGDGEQAVAAAQRHRPDLVLMDIRMPRLNGIEATRRILAAPGTSPGVPMPDHLRPRRVRVRGAAGGRQRLSPEGRALRAIGARHPHGRRRRRALRPLRHPPLIESFVDDRRELSPPAELDELTPRKLEVLRLLARGLSNAEIAERLVVPPTTVKAHVARVLAKLGLHDRVQAVVLAYEAGVVSPGEAG